MLREENLPENFTFQEKLDVRGIRCAYSIIDTKIANFWRPFVLYTTLTAGVMFAICLLRDSMPNMKVLWLLYLFLIICGFNMLYLVVRTSYFLLLRMYLKNTIKPIIAEAIGGTVVKDLSLVGRVLPNKFYAGIIYKEANSEKPRFYMSCLRYGRFPRYIKGKEVFIYQHPTYHKYFTVEEHYATGRNAEKLKISDDIDATVN